MSAAKIYGLIGLDGRRFGSPIAPCRRGILRPQPDEPQSIGAELEMGGEARSAARADEAALIAQHSLGIEQADVQHRRGAAGIAKLRWFALRQEQTFSLAPAADICSQHKSR